ncbi:5'-nucleotidase, lipoprotein e(P4) family [Chamaesiphon sp.]|uniref:5'-nucleotidase, lipoprotein e(P4) family n=1 Tax=Chamaesiphon sp. TaxID=2814140 RepID=UPI003593EC72
MLVKPSLSSLLTIYLTTVQKSIFSAALTAVALLSVGFKEPETPASLTQQQLNEQSVLALNWVQQSGEYAALTHQAFNTARTIFDYVRSQKIRNLAVIVDIDETVLDNSRYQAGLIDSNNRFNSSSWNQWIAAKQAVAVPGSVEFVNYVNANGGKVFFITDRTKSSQKDGTGNDLEVLTIDNLKSLGFTGVDPSTVILKGEFTKTIAGKIDTSKEWRRAAVINGQADGKPYNVVALIGDNLNDLDDKAGQTNQARRTYVESNKNRYGSIGKVSDNSIFEPAYITLPNPVYGAWELGIYNPKALGKQQLNELSPSQLSQQRKQALSRWLSALPSKP